MQPSLYKETLVYKRVCHTVFGTAFARTKLALDRG